jgi:hypothetical protein
VKSQDRESKLTQNLFETHNRKTGEVEKGIEEFGVILEEMSVVIRMILDFKQKDQKSMKVGKETVIHT